MKKRIILPILLGIGPLVRGSLGLRGAVGRRTVGMLGGSVPKVKINIVVIIIDFIIIHIAIVAVLVLLVVGLWSRI